MGFQIPFQSRSTLRLPEALSEGAAARGRQKEKNENGKDKRPTSRPLPSDPRIKPLRGQAAIHHLNQAANSSLAQTTRISPAEDPYANMEPIHIREKICIKAGEMQGDDLSLILIYPMRDIDQNVEAMCERVTDLVFLLLLLPLTFAVLTLSAWTRPSRRGGRLGESIYR